MTTFTVEVALGLALQAAALLLVVGFIRRPWIGHTGFLLVLMAVLYHGGTEIAQSVFPSRNSYRLLITQSELNNAVLIMSTGIFLFAVTYVVASMTRIQRLAWGRKGHVPQLWQLPPWQLMLALAAPLYTAALTAQRNSVSGYWLTGLSDQFLMLTLSMATFVFLYHFRGRFILIVIPLQIAMLVLIGQRAIAVFALVMVWSALARSGIRIKRTQVAILLAVLAAGILSISLTRLFAGREAFQEATLASRLTAVTSSLQNVLSGRQTGTIDSVLDDFVYRFDGNAFPALINGALQSGVKAAGFETVSNNFALIVPSFINPFKLDTGLEARSEEFYTVVHYGLPGGTIATFIDYLPTMFAMFYSFSGMALFLILTAVAGVLFAIADKWLFQRTDLARVTVGLSLTYCVLLFEQGLTIYFTTLRGAVAFIVAVFILNILWTIVVQAFARPRALSAKY